MPDDASGRLGNGRLNLEQQKKRAKELLRGLKDGGAAAAERWRRSHPKAMAADAQLADAQLVVAREAGFDSWPKLKAHTEALAAAREAARRPELAPDSPQTLHLRCGSDIEAVLKRAGFVGAFQMFTDPLCLGPVIDAPRSAFLERRADYLADSLRLYPDVVRRRLEGEYGALDELQRYERLVLWFEHDSYDQLILAYILKSLGEGAHPPAELVCADGVPGVDRFNGLGQLAPEVIRVLWERREPVTAAHVALGGQVWAALCSPTPEALFGLAKAGTPRVPPMAGAALRHLQELPSARNGLSLTGQLTLDLLAEAGPMTAQRLFGRLSREREPRPFLGDAMYWPVLAALAASPGPLIEAPAAAGDPHEGWPGRRVSLTPLGAAVREGRDDWMDHRPPPRWLGGIEIRADRPHWRWDNATGRPVLTLAKGA